MYLRKAREIQSKITRSDPVHTPLAIVPNKTGAPELKLSKSFEIGRRVTTPNGPGRVWEIYQKLNKIGVIVDGYDRPMFMSIELVEPYKADNAAILGKKRGITA